MRITNLYLKNFCAVGEASIDFQNIPMAIVGINNTDAGQETNGAGKSALLHGLFYGIYGDNLRKNLDRKLVRRGSDKAEIGVTIFCPVRKEELCIKRAIPAKGSATLSFSINGKDCVYGTINEGNKMISSWLGITAEDAKTYYIISKENYKSFFTSSNTDKLALISRFINFDNIDKTKTILDSKIGEVEVKIRKLEDAILASESKIEVYAQQIEDMTVEKIEEQRQARILKIRDNIEVTRRKIEDTYNSIEETKGKIEDKKAMKQYLNQSIKDAEDELLIENKKMNDAMELVKIQKDLMQEIRNESEETRKEKEGKNNEKSALDTKLSQHNTMLTRLKATLEGVIICPQCGRRFLLEEGTSLKEAEKRKKNVEKVIADYKGKIQAIQDSISKFDEILKEYSEASKEVYADLQTARTKFDRIEEGIYKKKQNLDYWKRELESADSVIERMNTNIANYHSDIQVFNDTIASQESRIREIESEPSADLDALQQPIIENINQEETLVKGNRDAIFALKTEHENLNRWFVRFKEFKMFLAVEQIKNIQAEANDTLDAMQSDLRILIEAFKLDSKGKAKEELTPYIFRDEMETYWYYSGGERARAEIAMILAIQSMINTTNPWGGLQFLYVDEVLDASDPMGIENIIRSLEFLKQPCLITTQISRVRDNIHSIIVTKDNGVASVKME